MARKLRLSFPGAIHHVMFRGNERHDIFRDDDDRQWFLDRLADSVESFTVRMYLVCLMSNHVHMLMETPRGNLSAFMGRLLTGYSVHFNRRHRRSGHLTQGRYRAQLVEGDNYLMRLSRYIHLNPVCTASWQKCSVQDRAAALRQYDWSTYRGYAGLAEQWPFVDEGPILAQMENLGLKDRAGYAAFVEAGLAQNDSDFSTLYAHAALSIGSPEFETNARTLHQRAAGKTKRREDVALRRHAGPLPVTFVLQKLAALLGVDAAAFRERRRNSPLRSAAAWALHRYAGMNQRNIADELCLGSGSAVSQQIALWNRQTNANAAWKEIEDKIKGALDETINC